MAASVISSVAKWKEFLTRYYKNQIQQLAVSDVKNKALAIEYPNITKFDVRLSEELLNNPDLVLAHAEDALTLIDLPVKTQVSAKIRVIKVPRKTQVRDLRSSDVNKLVSLEGTVRKITDVRPRILEAAFECARCKNVIYIPQEGSGKFIEPSYCQCNEEKKGVFRLLYQESRFEDYQRIKTQESPENLKGGEQPQTLDINVSNDLAGIVTPGEFITVTGILRSAQRINKEGKTAYFDIFLDCVSVELEEQEFDEVEISVEDEEEILRMSRDPGIYERIVASIAPSIYGYDEVKEAVAHQLFSGVVKNLPDGSRIRGDIHVLLVGDPGIAKSQILRYVVKLAPRGVYASGKSASSAGLTAAAVKDEFDGQWTLEAGALVLADKGIAAIDEMDKMKNEDRSSLHEGMEQQSYHPLTEVMLSNGRKVRISDLFDQIHDKTGTVIEGVDCEIVPCKGISILSTNMHSISEQCVDRVSRHKAPDHFVKIRYSNGREIIVTPEHPVFVAKDGISCVPASSVKVGDIVPAPRKLFCQGDTTELRKVDKTHPHEKDILMPKLLSIELGKALGYLVSEGHFYRGSSYEIGFTNKDAQLLADMNALMSSLFGFEAFADLRDDGTTTLRYISTMLYRWFESNFPELVCKSKERRIPSVVFRASEDIIKGFLTAAFMGDGCVHSTSVGYSTASRMLAEDYQDLLLMLGISSRIAIDRGANAYKVCIMGDSHGKFEQIFSPLEHEKLCRMRAVTCRSSLALRHHDTMSPQVIRDILRLKKSLGLVNDGYFNKHLDHGYGLTRDKCSTYVKELRQRHTVVKKELATARKISEVRCSAGWSQSYTAKVTGLTRGNVDYLENGGYDSAKQQAMTCITINNAKVHIKNAERDIQVLEEQLGSELRYLRVTGVDTVPNEGCYRAEFVYDVTVEPNHCFISQGIVLHNSISIAKAGIMATLKCRCAILGAANPKLGRFDPYESIPDQINMAPSLMSRFDLIFILQDKPEEKRDTNIAGHILRSHFAGELNEHRKNNPASHVTEDMVKDAMSTIKPKIDARMLRKYVAYAKRKVFPIMSTEARDQIINFYLNLRKQGEGDNAPIAVTARQLEGLVRLAEASARMRLSEKVTPDDAARTIRITMTSLRQVGMDTETGKLDIDVLHVGVAKSQRDRIKNLKHILEDLSKDYEGMVPLEVLIDRAVESGMPKDKVEKELKKLREIGEIFEPKSGHLSLS